VSLKSSLVVGTFILIRCMVVSVFVCKNKVTCGLHLGKTKETSPCFGIFVSGFRCPLGADLELAYSEFNFVLH